MTADPTKHHLGYGRRDAATGMLHGHIRWPDGRPPTPFGCRWCGIAQGWDHCQLWIPGRGFHVWAQPTQAQILARMLARRAARKAVCRCAEPWQQHPMAPVVDPWKCEADGCRMHDYLVGVWLTPMSFGEAMSRLTGRCRVIGHESPAEIAACVSLATGIFSASLVPFFLLIEAEHLTPRWLRESTAPKRAALAVLLAWDKARIAAIDGLLFLLHLAAPKGATR